MSTPRTFLLCDDELHAELVDGLIVSRLADVDGSRASRWSGVYTDGTRFSVLWASSASELFDVPDDQLVTESFNDEGNSDWSEVIPEPEVSP